MVARPRGRTSLPIVAAPLLPSPWQRCADRHGQRMELTSSTFADHTTLPLSAVDNIVVNGGMYNIPATMRMLPQNAGVANSSFGTQVFNDFFDPNYDGPCPPNGVLPFVHQYRFTVYALDIELTLPSSVNFPANAETLYHALIDAARDGHILASASIVGLFSATP
jgi:hypothetical protein